MADVIAPVTLGVSQALQACVGSDGLLRDVHPGLVLDKFARSWDATGQAKLSEDVQKPTVQQVVALSASPPPGLPFAELVTRWESLTANGVAFTGTTAGPLTLHLARASALENAGICLHPIYGFTYLPGSGLKGLARAFAETVWLPAQPNELAAGAAIRRVFGYVGGEAEPKATAGAVVFHDAWPRKWPRLVTDILNSHHAEYYSKANEPPGDWEDPVPVYFLSVPPGVPFRFAITKRRDDVPQEDADLAADWLAGGLTVLGCGAKTATGYGHFTTDRAAKPVASAARPSFATTLELVTPAFLAGAEQTDPASCDLRPATLRGQLRWWWRTLHAGFVDVPTLKRMEAAVWGDTKSGAAVRLTVSAERRVEPRLYSHPAQKRDEPPSGTRYAAYGMDENVRVEGQRVRRQRFVMEPGATWRCRLLARHSADGPGADELLGQAVAALWLLTQYGGVGSKCRKGFGSLQASPDAAGVWPTSLEECVERGAAFRRSCGAPTRPQFDHALADPGALADPNRQVVQIAAGRSNPWQLIERVGAAYSKVAAAFAHEECKAAFGLPRKIHGPLNDPLPHQRAETHQRPLSLRSPIWPLNTRPDQGRYASPIHLHVGKEVNGGLVVRLLALPARYLRNREENVAMLEQFARGFQIEFAALASAPSAAVLPSALPAKRAAGTEVRVTILRKRANGGFDVQEAGRPEGTLTLGSPPVGTDTSDGKTVTVRIHNDDPAKPQYKWSEPPKGGKR